MNTQQQRRENDAKGLAFVHRFGWLRAPELGRLMWPLNSSSREAASRLMRGWIERNLVIARELPERAGRMVVLSLAGVRVLAESGIVANTGKSIGYGTANGWLPPATWRHDLIATGVLCELASRGYRVVPEAQLRRLASKEITKLPDGLVREPAIGSQEGRWLWLETENARKTGPQMRHLADALCAVSEGSVQILNARPTASIVAYAEMQDDRGHQISHRLRVTRAIEVMAKREVEITFALCSMAGRGVERVAFESEHILPSRSAAILKKLNSHDWKNRDGSFVSHYGGFTAYVWEETEGKWGFQAERSGWSGPAGRAQNISEAKRSVAAQIASQ